MEHARLVAVLGVGGALVPRLVAGDVVVATEVRRPGGDVVALTNASAVAGVLAAANLRVVAGPVVSLNRLVTGARRAEWSATGAIAADLESAWLLELVFERPTTVVRVVVDGPGHPLLSPATLARGARSLRVLRRVAQALAAWADVAAPVTVREDVHVTNGGGIR
jgi:4-hydroxy-3-methylbut-2-enyl diphosphate reductase